MREIGPPRPPQDNGEPVFYVIRPSDVGRTVIDSEIGPIVLGNVMGRVLPRDVGKRIIRRKVGGTFFWSVENDEQLRSRLDGE